MATTGISDLGLDKEFERKFATAKADRLEWQLSYTVLQSKMINGNSREVSFLISCQKCYSINKINRNKGNE
jgi:hypothetical protein